DAAIRRGDALLQDLALPHIDLGGGPGRQPAHRQRRCRCPAPAHGVGRLAQVGFPVDPGLGAPGLRTHHAVLVVHLLPVDGAGQILLSQAMWPRWAKVATSRYSPQKGAPCGMRAWPLVNTSGTHLKPPWVGTSGLSG